MIWIFLACVSNPSSTSESTSEESVMTPLEVQDKVLNIENRSWKYPSTGLVESFQETEPRFLKAEEFFRQKEFTEAGTILIELIKEEPQNAAYHSLMSSVMLSMGDIKQAKTAALQAVRLYPSAITHVNLAGVYQANNEFELAEEHYNKAHHFSPKFFLPLRNLSSLRYQAGDMKGAEKYLRALMRLEPEDSYVYVSLAEVLTKQNREEEAKEILEYRIQELQWVDESEKIIDSGMMLDLPLILGELYWRDKDWKRAQYWFEYTIDQGEIVNSSLNDEARYQVEATTRLIEMYLELGMKEEGRKRFMETQKLITKEDIARPRHLEMELEQLNSLRIQLGLE